MKGRLAGWRRIPRLPRRTARLRLTVLYGALFVASGAALLTITYLLVRHSTVVHVTGTRLSPPTGLDAPHPPELPVLPDQTEQLRRQADGQRAEQLHQLLIQSGVALGTMAVISVGLGWLMAGRVLRPLRTMAAATRRISERNLHERLAMNGPRDELTDLGDTIDGLLARLETAFEAQRRFVANASHELRTPLAMIRTSLDVAAGKPESPPQLLALDAKIRDGLDRADQLLEAFLVLARAQHGALPDQAAVSLPELVFAAIERRGEPAAERGIDVHQRLHAAALTGSPTLLARMIANVVDNAIDHNEPSGWIRIETGTVGDTARLAVDNSGAQLDETTVRGLTQPFWRLDAERTNSQHGLGLGLSIVAAIVTAHGGRLELHPRDEGGMRVLIELPRTPTVLPVRESR